MALEATQVTKRGTATSTAGSRTTMTKTELAAHFEKRKDAAMQEVNDTKNDPLWREFQNGLAAAFTTAEAMVRGMQD